MELWRPQKKESLVPLVFLCLTLFTVLDVPAPVPLLSYVHPLHDSFIFHQSSTTESLFSPQLLLCSAPLCPTLGLSQCQRQMMHIVLVLSGGGGDRPFLACRPTSGPNDASWGSGEASDGVGLWELIRECEFLPQLGKNMLESIETILPCWELKVC